MRNLKITILFFILIWAVLCSISTGFSINRPVKVLKLTSDLNQINTSTSYIIEDSIGDLSIQKIMSIEGHDLFSKYDKQLSYNEHVNSVYWQKIILKNQTDFNSWLIEYPDLHIEQIEIFVVSQDSIVSYSNTGFEKTFNSRSINHKNFSFEIIFPASGQLTIYTKLKSAQFCGIHANVRSVKNFISYFLAEYYSLGLYYGIIFIMIAYNFFLGLYTKDRLYFFYCAYTVSCALYTFAEDGIGFQWIWGEYPLVNLLLAKGAPVVLLFSFLLYSDRFLDLKVHYPILRAYFLAYFVCYVYMQLFHFEENRLNTFLLTIPFIATCFFAIKIYLNGFSSSRFFVLGNSIIVSSLIVFYLRSKGWVPSTVFTVYLFNFGFIFEAVVLSISLADKIKITKDQKETAQKEIIHQLQINDILQQKVNKELEEKVKERTIALEAKSDELQLSNSNLEGLKKELYAMNSKMDVNIWELKKEVKKEVKARILNDTISLEEFELVYTDVYCFNYLKELKWKDGFVCPKCKNKKSGRGNNNFTFKCTQCQYQESVTSNTLFHAIKFPISKAFYIAYYLHKNGNDITYEELANKLNITKNTAYKFSKKVLRSIELLGKSSKKLNYWELLVLTNSN